MPTDDHGRLVSDDGAWVWDAVSQQWLPRAPSPAVSAADGFIRVDSPSSPSSATAAAQTAWPGTGTSYPSVAAGYQQQQSAAGPHVAGAASAGGAQGASGWHGAGSAASADPFAIDASPDGAASQGRRGAQASLPGTSAPQGATPGQTQHPSFPGVQGYGHSGYGAPEGTPGSYGMSQGSQSAVSWGGGQPAAPAGPDAGGVRVTTSVHVGADPAARPGGAAPSPWEARPAGTAGPTAAQAPAPNVFFAPARDQPVQGGTSPAPGTAQQRPGPAAPTSRGASARPAPTPEHGGAAPAPNVFFTPARGLPVPGATGTNGTRAGTPPPTTATPGSGSAPTGRHSPTPRQGTGTGRTAGTGPSGPPWRGPGTDGARPAAHTGLPGQAPPQAQGAVPPGGPARGGAPTGTAGRRAPGPGASARPGAPGSDPRGRQPGDTPARPAIDPSDPLGTGGLPSARRLTGRQGDGPAQDAGRPGGRLPGISPAAAGTQSLVGRATPPGGPAASGEGGRAGEAFSAPRPSEVTSVLSRAFAGGSAGRAAGARGLVDRDGSPGARPGTPEGPGRPSRDPAARPNGAQRRNPPDDGPAPGGSPGTGARRQPSTPPGRKTGGRPDGERSGTGPRFAGGPDERGPRGDERGGGARGDDSLDPLTGPSTTGDDSGTEPEKRTGTSRRFADADLDGPAGGTASGAARSVTRGQRARTSTTGATAARGAGRAAAKAAQSNRMAWFHHGWLGPLAIAVVLGLLVLGGYVLFTGRGAAGHGPSEAQATATAVAVGTNPDAKTGKALVDGVYNCPVESAAAQTGASSPPGSAAPTSTAAGGGGTLYIPAENGKYVWNGLAGLYAISAAAGDDPNRVIAAVTFTSGPLQGGIATSIVDWPKAGGRVAATLNSTQGSVQLRCYLT